MNENASEGPSHEQRTEVLRSLFENLRSNGVDVEDGVEVFSYTFTGEMGTVTVDFNVTGRIRGLGFKDVPWRDRKNVYEGVETLVSNGELTSKPFVDSLDPNEAAGFIAYLAMDGMKCGIRSAFAELTLETETLFGAFILSIMPEELRYGLPNVEDGVKTLVKKFAVERKNFLTKQAGALAGNLLHGDLQIVYPHLLKVWQSAKRIYEHNGESETWRDMVKAKYPEHTFDDDLLTRIAGKLETLPDEIQAKLLETDADHTPSSIALEHAARICGAAHYQHTTRYYFRLASKGGKLT